MKLETYIVVEANSPKDLGNLVSRAMEKGYMPYGSMSTNVYNGCEYLYQPMILVR